MAFHLPNSERAALVDDVRLEHAVVGERHGGIHQPVSLIARVFHGQIDMDPVGDRGGNVGVHVADAHRALAEDFAVVMGERCRGSRQGEKPDGGDDGFHGVPFYRRFAAGEVGVVERGRSPGSRIVAVVAPAFPLDRVAGTGSPLTVARQRRASTGFPTPHSIKWLPPGAATCQPPVALCSAVPSHPFRRMQRSAGSYHERNGIERMLRSRNRLQPEPDRHIVEPPRSEARLPVAQMR